MEGEQLASTNTLPVAEISSLLSEVSDHGIQHLVEAEADLQQTTDLLSGAIQKLSDSFMAVHKATSDQMAEIDALLNCTNIPTTSVERLLGLQESVSTGVNEAITALQFQDMTDQLITRVVKRISGLKDSLSVLAEHGASMDPAHEHQEVVRLLEEISAGLSVRNQQLKGRLNKSVRQEDMDSGEVELF